MWNPSNRHERGRYNRAEHIRIRAPTILRVVQPALPACGALDCRSSYRALSLSFNFRILNLTPAPYTINWSDMFLLVYLHSTRVYEVRMRGVSVSPFLAIIIHPVLHNFRRRNSTQCIVINMFIHSASHRRCPIKSPKTSRLVS